MPRGPTGTYTLPAGNPVVSLTTIDSSWANDTMPDLGVAMTDSLSRTGSGGMQSSLKLVDGSVGSPGWTFNNELNTGFYRMSTGDVRLAVEGVDTLRSSTVSGLQEWDGLVFVDLADADDLVGLQTQITDNANDILLRAPLASPTFTGTVTVPTLINTGDGAYTFHDNPANTGGLIKVQAGGIASGGVNGDFTYIY